MQGLIFGAQRDWPDSCCPRLPTMITWKVCIGGKHHIQVRFCEDCGIDPAPTSDPDWKIHVPEWEYLGPCKGECEPAYVTLPRAAEHILPPGATDESIPTASRKNG